jgi:uncharacterized protein YkwD
MFRKLWKTLKFFVIIAIILICLPTSILPKQENSSDKGDLEYYKKLNDREVKLSAFRDDDEALKNKLKQLDVINASRKRNGADPVKLDILASRVANKMCRDAAWNNFVGHFNLEGEKPYHRYAFAGGHDHVSENAYGEWTTGSYNNTSSSILSMMLKGHETFMAEKSPYDGHRKNIVNKSHNFVGIGYFLNDKQFRYYEEFVDRKFEFSGIPGEVATDQPFSIKLKIGGGCYLYYLVVYRENFPKPMQPEEISRRGSYEDFTEEQVLNLPAWDLAKFRKGFEYEIPMKFSREGLYYIQIFEDKKEISGPGSVNTAGKTPYSGIVIKVHR